MNEQIEFNQAAFVHPNTSDKLYHSVRERAQLKNSLLYKFHCEQLKILQEHAKTLAEETRPPTKKAECSNKKTQSQAEYSLDEYEKILFLPYQIGCQELENNKLLFGLKILKHVFMPNKALLLRKVNSHAPALLKGPDSNLWALYYSHQFQLGKTLLALAEEKSIRKKIAIARIYLGETRYQNHTLKRMKRSR